MRKMVAIGGCVVFAACYGLAAVWARVPAASAAQADQARVDAGRRLFAESCSSDYCHGEAGTGGGAKGLVDRRFDPEHLTRVIRDGMPGTAMPAFKGVFTPEQTAGLVAYVLSLSPGYQAKSAAAPAAPPPAPQADRPPPKSPAPVSPAPVATRPSGLGPGAGAALRGDPAAGQALFWDATQVQTCRICHRFQGKGGQVGPDLTEASKKPARELFLSIVLPGAAADSAAAMLALTTRDGQRFAGVKRDESDEAIRIYDTSSLLPVLWTVRKADVAKIDQLSGSAMPGDYASRYSLQELLDLVAYLKTADPAAQAGVTLNDLFY